MFLWYEYNVTTIPVESKVLAEVEVLKLKTCRLYHENILLQKIKDMIIHVLKNVFSASDIIEAVRGHFCFYGMNAM